LHPAPSSTRSSRGGGGRRVTTAGTIVVGSTLLLVAWGCFAFGAVYPWAYAPLIAGSAVVGLIGIVTGGRPLLRSNRALVAALLGIAVVAGLQLIPMPSMLLAWISPATFDFLRHYDLRFTVGDEPGARATALRHAISIAPEKTVLFLALFAGPLLLLAGLVRTLSRTAATRMASGVVFIGLALAVVAIVQKAVLGDQVYDGMRIYGFWRPEFLLTTPFGPFVNKNHFAGWMLMTVPLALGLAMAQASGPHAAPRNAASVLVWLSEPAGGRFLLYLVAAVIMALSLVMAGSRSGLGCFAVAICGGAAWATRRQSRGVIIGAIVAAVALVVVALQWAGHDAALQRFGGDGDSLGMRLSIWRMSAALISRFPLFGTGMNTFGTAMIVYQPSAEVHYNEAHNDYLQLLVEGGLVGFALVLAAIGAAIVAIRRRFRAGDDGQAACWVRTGATTGLVAIALQSLVEFSLQMPGTAVLFAVLLALALYVPAPLASPSQVPAGRRGALDAADRVS
jgi:O-antigen ligase